MNELPTLSSDDFERLTGHALHGDAVDARYRELARAIAQSLARDATTREVLAQIPPEIGRLFAERGWEWNGFYRLREDGANLDLGHANGPPVCTPLARVGGLFESGMCWDAMLSNQTLLAEDVSRWPGYVSCDGTSGLATSASLVAPVRGPSGSPVGVWDLDAKGALTAADARAIDTIFATLACVRAIQPDELGA